jgi:hypothetical protein
MSIKTKRRNARVKAERKKLMKSGKSAKQATELASHIK